MKKIDPGLKDIISQRVKETNISTTARECDVRKVIKVTLCTLYSGRERRSAIRLGQGESLQNVL